MINKVLNRISQFFKWLYIKLAVINDTPQKIALGFGLGVFLGIIPGAGPIAALVVSSLLRINRAAALFGCLLTNTWISIAAFLFAVKIGAAITGQNMESVRSSWNALHWNNFFEVAAIKVLFPILAGFFFVSLIAAVLAYIIAIIVISIKNKRRKIAR
jgi:uncharacterized protein (DUF2062 family)